MLLSEWLIVHTLDIKIPHFHRSIDLLWLIYKEHPLKNKKSLYKFLNVQLYSEFNQQPQWSENLKDKMASDFQALTASAPSKVFNLLLEKWNLCKTDFIKTSM